jgi:hypothetical protein
MLLTSSQKERIAELIELHHGALVVEVLGKQAVSKSLLKRIKAAGLYKGQRHDIIKRAFQFGQRGLLDSRVLKMSDAQFESYLEREGVVVGSNEWDAIQLLRRSFAAHVQTLSSSLTSKVDQVIHKADTKLHRQLVRKQRRALFLEIERRRALAEIAKDMAEVTRQQIGSAVRTVETETNNAYQEGRAIEILRKAGGGDPQCFKRPRHDACDECKKAYLEEDGVTPKVFLMSELVDNGSNIGKSRADRQPVLDSFHPHCACELQYLPPGFGFDENGTMVYVGAEKRA